MKFDNPSREDEFYDIEKTRILFMPYSYDQSRLLYDHTFTFTEQIIEHERSIYTFMDLIGDLGGVKDIIFSAFSIFISPISEHFFIIKFLR